jgi:ADP-ribosyl-[dinitrogen reductase] hydrolase
MQQILGSRPQRVHGALVAMLVGDALGVPYEFHPASDIPAWPDIEMTPPPEFARSHPTIAPGTWSDDGAQALALLASLLTCGRMDVDDFATRLLAWYEQGYMAVDGLVFDVGIQTSRAFRALKQGVSPRDAGPAEEMDNGNGSLMRVLPLALWHQGLDAELLRDAFAQSAVTHGHIRSKVCCALYCLWIRRLLDATTDAQARAAWADAVTALRALLVGDNDALEALEKHIQPDQAATGAGSGYVVDTLRSARMIFEATAPSELAATTDVVAIVENSLRLAIELGHDTDTTACVLGGLLGARYGINAVPPRWQQALRGTALVAPLLAQLDETT